MTKETAIAILRECQAMSNGDKEAAHAEADRVLCTFLNALGYSDIVAEWQKVGKWYA